MVAVGKYWCLTVLFLNYVPIMDGSRGDRSNAHRECINKCHQDVCSKTVTTPSSIVMSPKFNLLQWDCSAECEYKCMWKTVDIFVEHHQDIPQFYGKWPFIRLYGIQEPASAFFSVLNGAAHIYGIIQFRKLVIPLAPMYLVWHGYCFVALNTWCWSTLFHMRDFEFTEHMDYMGATALVTYQLFGLLARLLIHKPKVYLCTVSALVSLLCLYHIYSMVFIHFDYGYHIKVNVTIGVLNAIGWAGWCIYVRHKQTYSWKGSTVIVLIGLCLSLELADFPPIAWVFDAHSLWHAGTAPLTLLWYSFIVDDCNYLLMSHKPELQEN